MKLYFAIPVLAIMMLNSSCVSKKKFLAMQDSYNHTTDSLVVVTDDLSSKLASGENDFESTKQDLMISDAAKTDKISSLETQLKELQGSFDELTYSLENTEERYAETQKAKDQASYQMVRMNKEIATLRQDTVSLKYAIKLANNKSKRLEGDLEVQREKYLEDLMAYKKEIDALKKADATGRIKKKELERQLTIKQKEMDDIGDAFIALRKELLRAKTSGTPVDPNANANVSKIAKALGQY